MDSIVLHKFQVVVLLHGIKFLHLTFKFSIIIVRVIKSELSTWYRY